MTWSSARALAWKDWSKK